ncbi:hypothetical protein [Streptomyces sp. NBC_00258]|uniref:hypothetical protein n=1 Tax=Streptomyces sp. NBC_00258 TaxID=2903642 RepID=UPI002E2867CA|nr:hypothetical protein [Streptomyces sp. NBC_00258]
MRPVTLTPDHLPAEVRPLLDEYATAARAEGELQKQLSVSRGEARAEVEAELELATTARTAAYTALETATRDYVPQMRQSSANAFFASVERARSLIAEAEAALRNAAQATALHASIRDGKTNVNTDNERAARSKTRQDLMRNVSGLRDVLGDLPDGLD